MSESTNGEPIFSLPPEERKASPSVLSTTEKPTLPKTVQAPASRDASEIAADEIIAQKGPKSVDDAVAHAREGNIGEALKALRMGQDQPPTGLVELAELSAAAATAAAEQGKKPLPLALDPAKCAEIAQSFVGQDKKAVSKMLAKFNLSQDTKEAILDNIPEGRGEDRDVSQGEQDIRQAQVDALTEQAKQSAKEQIDVLNAQIREEKSSGKPESKRMRFLMQQRANVNDRIKKIEHWFKASPREWTGRGGSFLYWSIVLLLMIVIMEMAAINKMAGKTK